MSAATFLSRRLSEFLGVALFAVALLWVVALASHNAADPVWFFNTGADGVPVNFAGHVGAFLSELSYQLLGYAAFLIPVVLVVAGWHYFWCKKMDAALTKGIGAALLIACVSSFLAAGLRRQSRSEAVARRRVSRRMARRRDGGVPEPDGRDHPHPHAALPRRHPFDAVLVRPPLRRDRRDAARPLGGDARALCTPGAKSAAANKQRQEVLKKHLDKAPTDARERIAAKAQQRTGHQGARRHRRGAHAASLARRRRRRRCRRRAQGRLVEADAPAGDQAPSRATGAGSTPACRSPTRRRSNAQKGAYTLPPLALLDAPRTERKIDERQLMEGARLLEEKCREFSVEGSVAQIHPGPVVTDLRVQAGRRGEVQQDHRARRRSLSRDAGRVGADRPHSRARARSASRSRIRTAT